MSESDTSAQPDKLRFTFEPWGPAEDVINISLESEYLIGHCGYWEGRRKPSRAEWKSFRASLESAGVWSWKGRYPPEGGECVDDGAPWSLWVRWGNQIKRTSGFGEVPDTFEQVLLAIKQIVGKREQRT